MKRPLSISIIAWFLIVSSALGVVSMMVSMRMPEVHKVMAAGALPVPVQLANTFLTMIIVLVAGIFMLKGRPWSRWLYAGVTVLQLLVGLLTSPMKAMMIPGLVVFAVIAYFLFRQSANSYFLANPVAADATQDS